MDDIIKDEVLGELKYHKNNAWLRRLDVPFLNSNGNLKLVVQDDHKEGILDVQREAFKTYLQNEEKYKSCVTDLLLAYYKWNYEYIARTISDLQENDHKDVVTEKEVLEMAPLWYLFICRDGSFGYAFGCCWDVDNGIAVLLSESEPRVISRTQLKNLHKLNDPTVGLLVHDGKNAWKGLEVNKFFGKPENLEIELEGGVDEGITVAQQKAYADYLEKKEAHFASLTKLMLTAFLGDPALAEKSLNSDFKVVVASALPKTLFIDREGNYGWICYTSWNKSYLALNLSCEIPTWMLPNELRTYSSAEKVYDEVFGVMFKKSSSWIKLELCRFNNTMVTVPVRVRTSNKSILDEQRSIYKDYLTNQSEYRDKLKSKMLEYYHLFYDEFIEWVDLPEELDKDQVNKDNVLNIVEFTELFVDETAHLAWLCQSPTENSGLAFEWIDGEVKWNTLSGFMYRK